jgi:putative SOS response-associated peptidase YedK
MCNDYEQHVLWAEYCKMMQMLEVGISTQQSEIDLPQADDIKINDMAPVMRASGNLVELVSMNFSFPPSGPRGGPVFNFRSEGRSFANNNRCLIPASAFRVHGQKVPKGETPFHAQWRSVHGDRRDLPRGERREPSIVHDTDHCAGAQ